MFRFYCSPEHLRAGPLDVTEYWTLREYVELAASCRIQFDEMPSRAGVYFRPGNVGGLRLAFGSTGGDEDSLRGVTLECKPFSVFGLSRWKSQLRLIDSS